MWGNAEIIKSSVSMEDVLTHYGFHPSRYGRIPCPLHNGKDKNFSYKQKSFKCFVCGKSGTAIDFVMNLFNITFTQAVERINSDFRLGLSMDKPNDADLTALRERQRKEREEKERWESTAKQLAAEHCYWHQVSVHFAPNRPETYGSAYIHPLYAEAVKRIPFIEYQIEEHNRKRR
jgi:DNA primase